MRLLLILVMCSAALTAFALDVGTAKAQLRGHGGPIRALAISTDSARALSGSFDTSAILWSLRRGAAEQVLRLHDSAVNAVLILKDGRLVTAGEDARIGIWTAGKELPDAVLAGHSGPIVALAVSPDGDTLASGSWDRTIRLWPLAGGAPRVLEGHQQNVNGVAFSVDGETLVSVDYDGAVRLWPLTRSDTPLITSLPSPLNAVVVAPDGEIIAAGADGRLYFMSPKGDETGTLEASRTPITALAISASGARVAAASVGGSVAIVDRNTRTLSHMLSGSSLPVWAVAFLPDGQSLLTGGADRLIRAWNAATGKPIGNSAVGAPEDSLAAYDGDPGAQVFRACVACHTLKPDEGSRAGPTLHGIFGRRIATLPGYQFSDALKHLDIVWTPETIAKLFEVGPARFTPGTKMPEQRIGAPEDRAALVKFLEEATR
jgi:cytochrome c